MDRQLFEALQEFYLKCDRRLAPLKVVKTFHGEYYPTSLAMAFVGFKRLFNWGFLSKGIVFSDHGYGDGRIVALAEGFGMRAVGFESDPLFAREGRDNIAELVREGILRRHPTLIEGDFLGSAAYATVPFSSIGVFFHYINHEEDLARRIIRESRGGTKLIAVNGGTALDYNPLRLTHRMSATELSTCAQKEGLSSRDAIMLNGAWHYQNFYCYAKERGIMPAAAQSQSSTRAPASLPLW